MIIFGGAIMLILSVVTETFRPIKFLGHPMGKALLKFTYFHWYYPFFPAFMMVYIWGRAPENSQFRMSLFGIFTFRAPYFAWFMLLFSFFIGNPVKTDLLGRCAVK